MNPDCLPEVLSKDTATARVLIALGSNLPFLGLGSIEVLQYALLTFPDNGLVLCGRSSFWRTPAWPNVNDPPFVNAVAVAQTGLSPPQVLRVLHDVERHFGRQRPAKRFAPRTLDLDIIDYAGAIIRTNELILPHPRLHERAFVLAPLAEIAPDWVHPTLSRSAADLLAQIGGAHGLTRLAL